MDFNQFNKELQQKIEETKKSIEKNLLLKGESAALRFVDDNFRNQSWEGKAWKASNGTILVKSGTLRRGFESEVGNGQIKITNDVKYAKAHNEGFDGTITIPSHKRSKFKKLGAKKKKVGSGMVKSHTRKMKLPKRQFAPYEGNESPTLNKTINELISTHITNLLNK